MESGEGGEQCRMDIHDSIGKPPNKDRGEEPHEACQNDQFHLPGPKEVDQCLIEGLAGWEFKVIQHFGLDPWFRARTRP